MLLQIRLIIQRARRGSTASTNSKNGSRPNTAPSYALQSVGTLRGPILYQVKGYTILELII
jgi:hypothetical protein